MALQQQGRADVDEKVFDFGDVDMTLYSDDLGAPVPVKDKRVKKSKKASKGALHNKIQIKKVELCGERDEESDTKIEGINKDGDRASLRTADMRFTATDTAPKKYKNAGLWRSTKPKRTLEIVNLFLSGGLHDEDTSLSDLNFQNIVPFLNANIAMVIEGDNNKVHITKPTQVHSQKQKKSKSKTKAEVSEDKVSNTSGQYLKDE
ncbi:hypothetical protein H0H87_004087 [Tephrocybe sp. NHM501043]|nr:hypothetical protein H0H87_004087 [Tephrocybe sp. NHM501043]